MANGNLYGGPVTDYLDGGKNDDVLVGNVGSDNLVGDPRVLWFPTYSQKGRTPWKYKDRKAFNRSGS